MYERTRLNPCRSSLSRGLATAVALALAACGAPMPSEEETSAGAEELAAVKTFAATADAYVDRSHPAANRGGATALLVDQYPAVLQSYLKFSVSGLSGAVRSARLRLYSFNDSPDGPKVYVAGNSWAESTLTWQNKPALVGAALKDLGAVCRNCWVEVDVTAAVTRNATYTFALVPTSDDGVDFYSRTGTYKPQLVVTTATADATAPAVAISSPASGAQFTEPQTVTLQATASDDVGVARVEFYEGGALKGTDDSAPFTHAWTFTAAENGAYSWTAKAYDAAGNAASSAPVSLSVAVPALPPAPAGWTLYWSDEFDGTSLDTSIWKPYFNTYGDGNNELECNSPNNVRVANGVLTIQARRERVTCGNGQVRDFTTGFLGTRENGVYFPRYARYEMRAKVPHANALWPAFWLRHRDGASVTEIDVMEYFHAQSPGATTSTLHYNGHYNLAKGGRFFEMPTSTPADTAFHVWAAEIEPVGGQVCLKFFLDGKMVNFNNQTAGTPYCLTDAGPFARYPGQNLFDIAVNMAVGGNWVGHPDGPLDRLMNGTAVEPTGVLPTTFPSDYVVDYVRVYTR